MDRVVLRYFFKKGFLCTVKEKSYLLYIKGIDGL